MARVILRIGLFLGTEISDALYNERWIIPASKGAFCVGPILLGLALVPLRNSSSRFIAQVTSGVGRTVLKPEVARLVNLARLLTGFDNEFLLILFVGKTGQAQNTGGVGGCRIAAKLIGHRSQHRFGLLPAYAFDFPDDLVFARRSVENEVRRGNLG